MEAADRSAAAAGDESAHLHLGVQATARTALGRSKGQSHSDGHETGKSSPRGHR